MYKSISSAHTPNASAYIRKLCKHFAHKVDVDYDDQRGDCALPTGPASMQASEERITFTVESDSLAGLLRAKAIIEDHFVRFAYKEKIERLDWEDDQT